MFCFQCQETAKNEGCTVRGVCGKPEGTAALQDLLIFVCKGISVYGEELRKRGTVDREAGRFLCKALFTTVTDVAWDDDAILERIREGLRVRDAVREKARGFLSGGPAPGTETTIAREDGRCSENASICFGFSDLRSASTRAG